MEYLQPALLIAFLTLTMLEIVLGVDNIIFLTILVNRLPAEQRDSGRKMGLGFALLTRLALLGSLSWVMSLTTPLLTVFGHGISGRDFILICGGAFLLYKASHEIFIEVEAREEDGVPGMEAKNPVHAGAKLFWGTIAQIAVIDIVFSLDSVITAVGMVNNLPVMMAAVIASAGIMMKAAKPIGEFVERHPSVKVLALSFLTMVGMALIAEGFHVEVPKGYIYFSMGFSFLVEFLNIRGRAKRLAAKEAANAAQVKTA
jgi:predicted tellurium resistance membrane protein TerC